MDCVVIVLFSLVLYLIYRPETEDEVVEPNTVEQNPMLNPQMNHDEHAFMRIANELGFH